MSDIVIIGTGPAGISATEEVRKQDKNAAIKMITREQPVPYARIALADILQGELDKEDLSVRNEDFFSDYELDVISKTEVTSISPSTKTIQTRDNEGKKQELDYSKLLICTGASPFIPPIEGFRSSGVFTLGSLSDVENIQEFLEKREVDNCLVIGAGFIGLEAAEALEELGLNVHIVEILDQILPNLLDKSTADIFQKTLEEADIQIHLNTELQKISGDPVESVMVESKDSGKRKIPCDLVISAAGMKPNIDLAKNTQIKTNNGIIVNKKMETGVNDIYAAGDVTEAYNIFEERCVNLTWPSAVFQGKAAGANMVGAEKEYLDLRQNIIDVFDTKIVSIGRTPTQAEDLGLEKVWKNRDRTVRIGIFDSDMLVGFTSIGSEDAVEEAGAISALIEKEFEMENKEKIWIQGFSGERFIDEFGLFPKRGH